MYNNWCKEFLKCNHHTMEPIVTRTFTWKCFITTLSNISRLQCLGNRGTFIKSFPVGNSIGRGKKIKQVETIKTKKIWNSKEQPSVEAQRRPERRTTQPLPVALLALGFRLFYQSLESSAAPPPSSSQPLVSGLTGLLLLPRPIMK